MAKKTTKKTTKKATKIEEPKITAESSEKQEKTETKSEKNTKTLHRLPREGKIFGVCAGLAAYFEMDVTLMRIIFVILLFATSGIIVFIYLILAIVMPSPGKKNESIDEKIEDLGQDLKDNKSTAYRSSWIGIILLIIGLWLLLGQFFPWMVGFRWEYVWPMLLILLGLLVIARRK